MKHHNPGFLAIVADAKARIRECTIADVRELQASGAAFTLVDVREESEVAAGKLVGAVHLGKGVIERDIETVFPDKDTPLICYCGGGYRSALVCDTLQQMGYTNVQSMDGGWRAWTAAGAPIEAGR